METAADATELRPLPPRKPQRTRHRGPLKYPVVRQLLRFTGVGVVCTASSLAIYALLRPWIDPQLANAVALILTSLMNTALNRRLTFKITGRKKRAQDHLSGVIVIGIALIITGGSLGVLHLFRPDATVAEELWTTTLSGFVATAVRFTLLRHWIFRRARHV
ncbi:GtrA family protein [Paenarthrobacter nitroguajacolicus]|uniref:GtrA family protein n=1 Tax=Paenarthrobacter nitroguajacolicus TaxID=211146 RepID=A0A558H2B5_PAENT|nr:GtrA family protein [Paenarthrobacter nitroguajacolicus]TVU63264.1 GtrA family protein [Paenarthrobacter nitroguajacolicus]